MITKFSELKDYLISDAYRCGYKGYKLILYYIRHPEYRYVVWLRIAQYSSNKSIYLFIYLLSILILQNLRNKTGIQIPVRTKIGKAFFIGHFGSIVINNYAIIGDNCTIISNTTIGVTYRGKRAGVPIIGDSVYIGPGSRIFGRINIGNNVAIGANAVVNIDIPDNSVVGGVPCKILSMNGSDEYIRNKYLEHND